MFEQFRILRTALRLGTFTIPELAAASGVSEGTVQKTLKRLDRLFVKSDARRPGANGRSLQTYLLDREAARDALQEAADAVPAMTVSEGADEKLAVAIARDSLLAAFPTASAHDRPLLLAAAKDELETAPPRWDGEALELSALRARLLLLVEVQQWLARLKPSDSTPGSAGVDAGEVNRRILIATIEEILAARCRQQRDKHPDHRRRVAPLLLDLPARAGLFASQIRDSAPPPPHPQWSGALTSACWSLTNDPLWADVAGDMVRPEDVAEVVRAKAEAPRAPAAKEAPVQEQRRVSNPARAHEFAVGDLIVYPAHGVGQVYAIETQEVAGLKLEVYVIHFDHEKMTLRVPTAKSRTAGLRPLAETGTVSAALSTLKGRARVRRTMWSRRAQEYEAKINSGDLIAIAEVVRDLHPGESQTEQSYSERQLYEAALDRMAREVSAIERIDRDAAKEMLTRSLTSQSAAA